MIKAIIRLRTLGAPLFLIVVLVTFMGAGTAQATPTATPACHAKSWRIVASPNTSATYNSLNSVAAFSANDVWAVGQTQSSSSSSNPLAEHWNGRAWRVVPTPSRGQSSSFTAVTTIPGTHELWAVGSGIIVNPSVSGVAELWNGTRWKIIPTPAINSASFSGIVALSATNAWAVGTFRHSSQMPYQALIEHWNGKKWSQVPVVVPSDAQYSSLSSVTAFSATDVWAVGSYDIGFEGYTLMEHWNGRQWNVVSAPSPGPDNILLSVTRVPHTNHLWAAGFWTGGTVAQSFIEYWNGRVWSVVSTPRVGISNQFFGVIALSAKSAWVVGSYSKGPGMDTLTEYWNGRVWSLVSSPNRAMISSLYGLVRVPGSDTLWAVGSDYNSQSVTLTERYS